jgi:hypothetical protein
LVVPWNFIECGREQAVLLPPSLREWLAEDHLAWFLFDAVEGEWAWASSRPGIGRTGTAPLLTSRR